MIKAKNKKRTDRVWGSLVWFYAKCRRFLSDEDIRSATIELMTDIRHHCDRWGLKYDDLEQVAEGHYLKER